MGVTLTDANTLILLGRIGQVSAAKSATLTRVAVGARIGTGKDDPAGLIALKALDAEYTAAAAALDSSQRTNAMLGKVDADLKEVSDLLGGIEALVAHSIGDQVSESEKAANQAQIDSAIDSLDRIVRTSRFNGKNLLNGSLGIRATGDAGLGDLRLYTRNPDSPSTHLSVTVEEASRPASWTYTGSGGMAISFIVTGKLGSATLEFSADETGDILGKINATAAETGVMVSAAGSALLFKTVETGADQFVSIRTVHCSNPNQAINAYAQNGSDARVRVNGERAGADGNRISFNTNGLSGSFTLTSTGDTDGAASTLRIDGGGATFSLGTEWSTRSTIGISALFSHTLGKTGLGFLNELKSGGVQDLSGTGKKQLAIVKEAINAIAEARGRVGGFQEYQVQTAINSLRATQKSLTDAKGVINDVDYAQETAELNRQSVLMQSSLALLGVMDGRAAQVLSLLARREEPFPPVERTGMPA